MKALNWQDFLEMSVFSPVKREARSVADSANAVVNVENKTIAVLQTSKECRDQLVARDNSSWGTAPKRHPLRPKERWRFIDWRVQRYMKTKLPLLLNQCSTIW